MEVDGEDGKAMNETVIIAVQLEKDGSAIASFWNPRTQKWTFGTANTSRRDATAPSLQEDCNG